MPIIQISKGNSSMKTLLREGLQVKFTNRNFPYILLEDKNHTTIRIQQSSAADMSDIWIFVEPYFESIDKSILLTTENLNDINLFKKYIEENNWGE